MTKKWKLKKGQEPKRSVWGDSAMGMIGRELVKVSDSLCVYLGCFGSFYPAHCSDSGAHTLLNLFSLPETPQFKVTLDGDSEEAEAQVIDTVDE